MTHKKEPVFEEYRYAPFNLMLRKVYILINVRIDFLQHTGDIANILSYVAWLKSSRIDYEGVHLKELKMIFIEIFIFSIINALSFKNDFGENRIKFRLLVFELSTLEHPGSMSAKF